MEPQGVHQSNSQVAQPDPADELEQATKRPWWSKSPLITVAIVLIGVALAAGLLVLIFFIVLMAWIMSTGGLFPNK